MSDILKTTLSKTNSALLKIAAISTGVLALYGIYTFYKNEIWHPKVQVLDVDWKNGIANLLINGKKFVLKGDSSYLIANDWGIKFGYTYNPNGTRNYDRIEVLKRNMVHEVIRGSDGKPQETGFVGDSTIGDEENFWNRAFDNK